MQAITIADEIPTPTGISAKATENAIVIDYNARAGEEIAIYRSSAPIVSANTLVGSVLIDTIAASSASYSDHPLPGVSYYYGIFYSESVRTGAAQFEPGENVLAAPVRIAIEAADEDKAIQVASRVRPLPFLMLSSTIDTGEQLKAGPFESSTKEVPLAPQTLKSVSRLLEGENSQSKGTKNPSWLAEDESDGIFNQLLQDLVQERLWEAALNELNSYLQTRRTTKEMQKAYFYMGQCYYFLEKYEQAFVHFVFAEDSLYPQVQPWLDDLFALLASL